MCLPHMMPCVCVCVCVFTQSSDRSSHKLLHLLQALALHTPDYGKTLLHHLLGCSPGTTPIATPIAVELFHRLCTPSTDHGVQRLISKPVQ